MTAPTFLHVRADLGAFEVTGADRLTWLNGLVTQEVGKLPAGAGAYALAVGKTGKIQAELWILAAEGRAVIVAERERVPALREHFEKHLIMEDAELGPDLDRQIVFVHGPAASRLVDATRARGGDAAVVDWTGRGDAAVLVSKDDCVAALSEMEPSARALGDVEWEAKRIAWGVPRAGVDFDQAMPQEASLERLAVSFNKGCYLGQEAVFMLEKRGQARRKLARVAIDAAGDGEPASRVEIVLSDGAEVGSITSVTPAEGGGWLAIASVKTKHAAPGTPVSVAGHAAHVLGLAGGGAGDAASATLSVPNASVTTDR